ncbi:Wadjet anti-phage system protein JetA family protein [Luteolibacter algae]|uniref:Wadjet anti-phage system protein JetA family protein n=1 Tax=Luteolibacter algae TaxID=454151 RepID=A0ABW5D4X3_9BACT
MTENLSTALFRETRGAGFFRVLTGGNASFYIDVLSALEQESSDRPDGMSREEVILLIIETLERHPDFVLEDEVHETEAGETDGQSQPREKARALLDFLLKNHWLDEPPRRDWRRMIHFDAHGATLITALRKIAWPEAAVFTDKLVAVCGMLNDETELTERPWQMVESCLANVREGLNELRAMQKSVQRFTRRQLEEETLRGNLEVVFDDYSEQVSHACYAEMVRARLPLRLPEAVRRISERLMADADALAEMQTEVLRRHPEITSSLARATVLNSLDELISLVERVLPMADEIDRRTADFTRRSLSRFRYLQDVSGERRTEIKATFEVLNRLLTGKRITQSASELPDLPEFRVPSVKLPAGLDSLYNPPARRAPIEQDAFEDSAEEGDREAGLSGMGKALRDSLSIQRANSFVKSLEGTKGDRIQSADLDITGEGGFTDLISLLLHAESAEARYRLEPERILSEDASPPLDSLEGCKVERFSIIKK